MSISNKLYYSSPLLIAGIYLLLSLIWITYSDQWVLNYFDDPLRITAIQTYKGWGFVTVSALFIGFLIYFSNNRLFNLFLEKSETQKAFEATFEQSGVGIVHHDLDYNWIRANQQICNKLRCNKSELYKKPLEEFIHDEDIERGKKLDGELLSGERSSYQIEKRYLRSDGSYLDALLTKSLAKDDSGEPMFFVATIKDISKQKETERQLEKAYRIAGIGSWVLDLEKNSLYWSAELKKFHGVPEDYEPDLESALEFYKSEDRKIIENAVQEGIEQAKPFEAEARIVSAKGNEQWIRVVGEPEIKKGRCVKLYGSTQDIDKRKRAEEALQLSEQRFKSVVQEGFDLIAILDVEANYTYVAPSSERVVGIPADSFIGKNTLDFIHEEDRGRIAEVLANSKEQQRIEIDPFRFMDGEGNWRWIETVATNLLNNPAVQGFVTNSRDVTEKIEHEQRLRQNLEFYHYATKAANDWIYDWYISKNQLFWSEDFPQNFMKEPDKYSYPIEDWLDAIHPDDRREVEESFNQALNDTSTTKWINEYRMISRQGVEYIIFERGYIIRNSQGQATRMIGSLQDITERKQYEAKLEKLSMVASKTTDLIIITDKNDKVTWVNEAFINKTGYTLSESRGKNPGDFLRGEETDPETIKRIESKAKQRQPIKEIILNYTKDGEPFWLDMTIDPIFDENGEFIGYIGVDKDVTDKIQKEQQLKRTLREKDILLTEVHHRVKNNLAVISSMMHLQSYSSNNKEVQNKLQDSAWRIKTMANVHDFLYNNPSFSELDLTDNLEKIITETTKSLPNSININLNFDNTGPIFIDVNLAVPVFLMVNEVTTNILKHAFQGQRQGNIEVKLIEEEDSITLHILDDGIGLPEDLSKISHKTLGLRIITALANQIDAKHEFVNEQNGSRFSLYFDRTGKQLKTVTLFN